MIKGNFCSKSRYPTEKRSQKREKIEIRKEKEKKRQENRKNEIRMKGKKKEKKIKETK